MISFHCDEILDRTLIILDCSQKFDYANGHLPQIENRFRNIQSVALWWRRIHNVKMKGKVEEQGAKSNLK